MDRYQKFLHPGFHRIHLFIYRKTSQIRRMINDRAIDKVFRENNAYHVNEIPTHTTKQELKALFSIANTLPSNSNIVEIGSYLGASTCFLAAGLVKNGGKLICIDTWQNENMPEGVMDTYESFYKNIGGLSKVITTIRARSDQVKVNNLPPTVHMAFIDGDHTYEMVNNDVELVSQRIPINGVLALHDHAYWPGVQRVLGEIIAAGNWTVIGVCMNLIWLKKVRSQTEG